MPPRGRQAFSDGPKGHFDSMSFIFDGMCPTLGFLPYPPGDGFLNTEAEASRWILERGSINIPLSCSESSPRGDALLFPGGRLSD